MPHCVLYLSTQVHTHIICSETFGVGFLGPVSPDCFNMYFMRTTTFSNGYQIQEISHSHNTLVHSSFSNVNIVLIMSFISFFPHETPSRVPSSLCHASLVYSNLQRFSAFLCPSWNWRVWRVQPRHFLEDPSFWIYPMLPHKIQARPFWLEHCLRRGVFFSECHLWRYIKSVPSW